MASLGPASSDSLFQSRSRHCVAAPVIIMLPVVVVVRAGSALCGWMRLERGLSDSLIKAICTTRYWQQMITHGSCWGSVLCGGYLQISTPYCGRGLDDSRSRCRHHCSFDNTAFEEHDCSLLNPLQTLFAAVRPEPWTVPVADAELTHSTSAAALARLRGPGLGRKWTPSSDLYMRQRGDLMACDSLAMAPSST